MLLLYYFKDKFKLIIAFISFILIFDITYALYNIELFPMYYASFIVFSAALVYGVLDFVNYLKRYRKLNIMYCNIEDLVLELPKADGNLERLYQEIIKKLIEDKASLTSKMDIKEKEMLDYYTMWVHQIKTPISAIKMLLQEKNDIQLEQELFKIEQYVEMVLHYLRLETMSSDLILKEHSLYDIIKQAVKKFSIIFINKKISLNFDKFDLRVITDEKWLVFVIEQLISNALKYTKSGTISIYLQTSNILVIEDTGIGIREEDLPRIFEKGFTGYNGRMDKKSTGIGLYLCKKILDRLSFKINVSSEVGKGSKIYIDFSTEKVKDF